LRLALTVLDTASWLPPTRNVQFEAVYAAYCGVAKDAAAVHKRFEAVRMRGRKRLAFG
jgi:tRNA A-37 threonylcarbamoyl transferase component Bud32